MPGDPTEATPLAGGLASEDYTPPTSSRSTPARPRASGLWGKLREGAAAAKQGVQDANASGRKASTSADKHVDTAITAVGMNAAWCEHVVDSRQFAEYPATTLLVARVCKVTLVFFICLAVFALMSDWLFGGTLGLMDEVIQVNSLSGPRVALCAQPWGTKFAASGVSAGLVTVPTGKTSQLSGANYSSVACPPAISGCSCLDFTSINFAAHGKRGELTEWQYVDLAFDGKNALAGEDQYALGFFEGKKLPQTWTYANLGRRLEGDLRYEEVVHGQTEFTDGEAESRIAFRVTGESHRQLANTQVQFGYDKFLIYSLSAYSGRYGIIAVLSVLLMLCAAVNNFGLFDIFFPEKLDEDDPAQLSVSPMFSAFCSCCVCCVPLSEKEIAANAARRSSKTPTAEGADKEP